MKLLKWYWFHVKRALDLHEGKKNWLKERNSLKEMCQKWWSLFITIAMANVFVTALAILVYFVITIIELLGG
jgi:hypothetical protein